MGRLIVMLTPPGIGELRQETSTTVLALPDIGRKRLMIRISAICITEAAQVIIGMQACHIDVHSHSMQLDMPLPALPDVTDVCVHLLLQYSGCQIPAGSYLLVTLAFICVRHFFLPRLCALCYEVTNVHSQVSKLH